MKFNRTEYLLVTLLVVFYCHQAASAVLQGSKDGSINTAAVQRRLHATAAPEAKQEDDDTIMITPSDLSPLRVHHKSSHRAATRRATNAALAQAAAEAMAEMFEDEPETVQPELNQEPKSSSSSIDSTGVSAADLAAGWAQWESTAADVNHEWGSPQHSTNTEPEKRAAAAAAAGQKGHKKGSREAVSTLEQSLMTLDQDKVSGRRSSSTDSSSSSRSIDSSTSISSANSGTESGTASSTISGGSTRADEDALKGARLASTTVRPHAHAHGHTDKHAADSQASTEEEEEDGDEQENEPSNAAVLQAINSLKSGGEWTSLTHHQSDLACSAQLLRTQCDPSVRPEPASPGAAAYWEQWREKCCKHTAAPAPTHAMDADKQSTEKELTPPPQHQLSQYRSDIGTNPVFAGPQPNLQLGTCLAAVQVPVPRFQTILGANQSSELATVMTIEQLQVPARLKSSVIRKIKGYAMSQMNWFDPDLGVTTPDAVRSAYLAMRWVNMTSGFVHPAATVGPAELALMKARLHDPKEQSIQKKALEILLSGDGVPKKVYPPTNWAPPTDTPRQLGASGTTYDGPYPIETIQAGWYGGDGGRTRCPENYPADAPRSICGHISLVELDGQMAYKEALAYRATGDQRFARNAFDIIDTWSKRNKEIGLQYQNGPLESGWAVASMAKALELLRGVPGWKHRYDRFMSWTSKVALPSMDFYVFNISAPSINKGVPHVLGNWHSTVAEAWMSVALLTDDQTRFFKAVHLFNETAKSYLKWGKGEWAVDGRVPGECSETLRDIFHSEFGLGGLLQVAEMAWQQDIDLYSAADYGLLAALELHARIINAGRNESLLPPGFKFVESMPQPAAGTFWKFDIRTQAWWAHNSTDPEQRLSQLKDGVKYLVGIQWLPTGWELGYNHYAGRLGIAMPETAELLEAHPVEFFSFHWGLGTLTHAESAQKLWREGLQTRLLCEDPAQRGETLRQELAGILQQQRAQQRGGLMPMSGMRAPLDATVLRSLPRNVLLKLLRAKLKSSGLSHRKQHQLLAAFQRTHRGGVPHSVSESVEVAAVSAAQSALDYTTVRTGHQTPGVMDGLSRMAARVRNVGRRHRERWSDSDYHHGSRQSAREDRKAERQERVQARKDMRQSLKEAKAEWRHEAHGRALGSRRHKKAAGALAEIAAVPASAWSTIEPSDEPAEVYQMLWPEEDGGPEYVYEYEDEDDGGLQADDGSTLTDALTNLASQLNVHDSELQGAPRVQPATVMPDQSLQLQSTAAQQQVQQQQQQQQQQWRQLDVLQGSGGQEGHMGLQQSQLLQPVLQQPSQAQEQLTQEHQQPRAQQQQQQQYSAVGQPASLGAPLTVTAQSGAKELHVHLHV